MTSNSVSRSPGAFWATFCGQTRTFIYDEIGQNTRNFDHFYDTFTFSFPSFLCSVLFLLSLQITNTEILFFINVQNKNLKV